LLEMPGSMLTLGDSALLGPRGLRKFVAVVTRGARALAATGAYAVRLRRLVQSIRPAVVHSNGIKFHLLSRALPRELPVVWHLRDFLGMRPLMARALRWAVPTRGAAIAISAAVADDARRVLPGMPVHLVYNGVDADYFCPGQGDSTRLDNLAGVPAAPSQTLRIGLVATYGRWKGQDVFLDAMALVQRHQSDPPLRFYLVGGSIYDTQGSEFSEAELRAKAAELGINAMVGFVPFQGQMLDIYRDLDVVVHASRRPEPFGRTIVEAMACEKPVIVSSAGGAAELFTHEQDALATEPGNAPMLAEAILRLAASADLRRTLGRNGRRTVLERFHRDRLGPQVLAVYERLTGVYHRPEALSASKPVAITAK
jgi:glycosyltransferase involved in cell wall biosynthesis